MLLSNLSIIVRYSQIFASRNLEKYDLNSAEQLILMYLLGSMESNQEAIAQYYKIDKGSVARTLAKLESKGYISRELNNENQREKVITLTQKSFDIKEMLTEQLSKWNDIMFNGISQEQASEYEAMTSIITANILKSFQ